MEDDHSSSEYCDASEEYDEEDEGDGDEGGGVSVIILSLS